MLPNKSNITGSASTVLSVVALVSLTSAAIAAYRLRRREKALVEGAPPGSLGLWGLGEMLSFLRDPLSFDSDRMQKYGTINYTTHILFSPVVRCITLEDRQRVFRSEGKGEAVVAWPDHWQALLGFNGVATVTGERHSFLRKFFHNSFTPETLKSYSKEVDVCIVEFLSHLDDGHEHKSSEFKALALDIFLRTIFGSKASSEDLQILSSIFATWIDGLGALIPYEVPFTTYGRAMAARRKFLAVIRQMVVRCNGTGSDLLTKFVVYRDENGEGLTTDEICENILVLMFAGHDTTAASFGTVMSFLFDKKNSKYLDKLRVEAKGLEVVTDQTLKSCEILCNIIDEAWREMPPILGSFRIATKDIVLSDGSIVREGVRLSTSTVTGHRDTVVWGKMGFDPDRFGRIREQQPEVLRTHYYPFGAGNRLCVGEQLARMELRYFLFHLARDWDVDLITSRVMRFPMNSFQSTFRLRKLQKN